jgi:hypothetical protein
MNDPQKPQEPKVTRALFINDCDLLEVNESDTQPGRDDGSLRRWMEAKWGKKQPPENGSADKGA